MDKYELKSEPRNLVGRKVKQLRKKHLVPANIYGKKIASVNIQLDVKEFSKLFSKIGESTLTYLTVKGEKDSRPVFIGDVTKHPVTEEILHVVFHQVDLKEKVTAHVSVKLIGEAIAEKEKLGILVQQLDELEVEALPTDMPDHIEVDVSPLDQVGTHIKVEDLKIDPKKITVKTEPETIIVQIEELAKEEVAPVVTPEAGAEAAAESGEPADQTPAETPTSPEEKPAK